MSTAHYIVLKKDADKETTPNQLMFCHRRTMTSLLKTVSLSVIFFILLLQVTTEAENEEHCTPKNPLDTTIPIRLLHKSEHFV